MSIRRTYSAPTLVPKRIFGWKVPLWLSWIFGLNVNYSNRVEVRNFYDYNDARHCFYIYIQFSKFVFSSEYRLYSFRIFPIEFPYDIRWNTINYIPDHNLRTAVEKRIKIATPYLNDLNKQFDLKCFIHDY